MDIDRQSRGRAALRGRSSADHDDHAPEAAEQRMVITTGSRPAERLAEEWPTRPCGCFPAIQPEQFMTGAGGDGLLRRSRQWSGIASDPRSRRARCLVVIWSIRPGGPK